MRPKTTSRKTVSIDASVCIEAMKEAKKQNRTLSNYVNTLLREKFNIPTTTTK